MSELSREQIEGIKEYANGGRGWPDGHEIWPTMAKLCDMALRSLDGWIACEERLPERHAPVALISMNRWEACAFDRNVQATGYLEDYGSGRPFWSTPRTSETLDSYTHWRPLPPPPSQEGGK